jgi:hypothetical protein
VECAVGQTVVFFKLLLEAIVEGGHALGRTEPGGFGHVE